MIDKNEAKTHLSEIKDRIDRICMMYINLPVEIDMNGFEPRFMSASINYTADGLPYLTISKSNGFICVYTYCDRDMNALDRYLSRDEDFINGIMSSGKSKVSWLHKFLKFAGFR